jgi:hypothetical protein
MLRHHWIQFTLYSVAVLMITGCGDPTSETSEARLSDFWSELEGCALCHSPQGQEAEGPDLSSPSQFVSNLVGKRAANYPNWAVTGTCSGTLPYITAGASTKSTLLAALVKEDSDTMEAKYGCFSSYNIHAVNQVTIEKNSALYNELVSWIDAGAKNN